jgi:hypothetical protein
MSQPIYKMFMFRNSEAYYQASEEERHEILGKLDAAFQKAGGKRLVWCNSYWSSDQWQVFGVEVFPNIEAVQQYSQAMNELNLSRYVESVSLLGTEFPTS